MALPVVGLTGGIASGKSTVARMLAAHGAALIDADALARDVVAAGQPALAEIAETFGPEVLQQDGTLDRAALGARVFEDPEARQRLNSITHPRIAMLGMQKMQALQDSGAPYIVYEAALIVENGAYKTMDALVVVALDPAQQLQRLVARDALPSGESEARIASQAPLEAKVAVADFVVENHGSETDLRSETQRVHEALMERFSGRAQ